MNRFFDPEATIELKPSYTSVAPALAMGFRPLPRVYNYRGFSDIDIVRQDVDRILAVKPPCGLSRHPITVVCHALRQLSYDAEPFDPTTIIVDGLVFSIEGREAVWLA